MIERNGQHFLYRWTYRNLVVVLFKMNPEYHQPFRFYHGRWWISLWFSFRGKPVKIDWDGGLDDRLGWGVGE